jgi:hypothetical protein
VRVGRSDIVSEVLTLANVMVAVSESDAVDVGDMVDDRGNCDVLGEEDTN